MFRYLVLALLLLLVESVFSTPSTFYYISKVENPEHYDSLAKSHDVIKTHFSDWKIIDISTPYEQNGIVFFYINMLAPDYVAPKGVAFQYGAWLKFTGDSLINRDEISGCRIQLKDVISHIEEDKSTRLFRQNVNVESEYLYWNGGYIFEIRSHNADTLVTSFKRPSFSRGYVWWFSFYSPTLLDILEIYLGISAFDLIPRFKKNVGIGHVRFSENRLYVSSGKDCTGTNSCFLSSGGKVTSYKLSMGHDWAGFAFFEEAIRELNYYLLSSENPDCLSGSSTNKLFALLAPPKKNVVRRVYMPLDCNKKIIRMISFETEEIGNFTRRPVIQDISVIDSLLPNLEFSVPRQYLPGIMGN